MGVQLNCKKADLTVYFHVHQTELVRLSFCIQSRSPTNVHIQW